MQKLWGTLHRLLTFCEKLEATLTLRILIKLENFEKW